MFFLLEIFCSNVLQSIFFPFKCQAYIYLFLHVLFGRYTSEQA